MGVSDYVIFIVQTLGAVSFALSGSLTAMSKRMDPFGVIVIAITTTFGGGLMRDIIIGRIPPAFFADWDCRVWTLVCALVAILVVCSASVKSVARRIVHIQSGQFLNVVDAMGLSVFCVFGVDSAMNQLSIAPALTIAYKDVFLLTFMGFITGVGGGILRDLFTGEIPMIFKKHIYALPTIVGSLAYVYLLALTPHLFAMLIVIAGITVVRILAAKFHWDLPIVYARIEEIEKEEEAYRRKKEWSHREAELINRRKKGK